MKTYKKIIFYSILQLMLITTFGQHIFIVEKPGTVNSLKYYIGERIDLKTKTNERIIGVINQIMDTAIIVNHCLIINDDISIIYTKRTMISILSSVGITGGLSYVGIDGINNSINNERPVFRNSVLKTGGVVFGVGLLLNLVSKRKRHINNQDWRIKVLNFSILKDTEIYAKPSIEN